MSFRRTYSQKINSLQLDSQRESLIEFLEGDGELVLDVANPERQPSFENIESDLEEGVYLCVNPRNVAQDKGFARYEGNENVLLTNGDGLSDSSINDVIRSFEDYQDASVEPEQTAYVSKLGVPFMFKYCDRGVGSFQDYDANSEEDLEELTEIYAGNLDRMNIDHVSMTFPNLMDVASFYEGRGTPEGTPRNLFEGIEEGLREKGWDVAAGEYSNVERTFDYFEDGVREEERINATINAER